MRKRKSSAAGASRTGKVGVRDRIVRLAKDIRFNDYVDLYGKPCRVLDASTEGGLCYFRAINILDGFLVWKIVPSSSEIVIAHVKRELYQLIGISSKHNTATLLHHSGDYVRDDIKLPQNEFLRNMMVLGIDNGFIVYVTVASALGKEAVYSVEVDSTGSTMGYKRNEDAVNQNKTNDSDVVVVNQSKTKDSDVVVVNQSKTNNSDVVVNQSKIKDSDVVVVNQIKTKNSDVAKTAWRSYRDVVLGHNDIY
ncbi:Eukaryotic translation initiation factor 5A-2 [Cardamine amara subsp. amara]|uniref:Eukaryotic translation initiation factor 5A-2 n=1 Tax=Cardamine amara subsp. amara TaxID=228776 RepID=A0ABD1A7E9_CARAN